MSNAPSSDDFLDFKLATTACRNEAQDRLVGQCMRPTAGLKSPNHLIDVLVRSGPRSGRQCASLRLAHPPLSSSTDQVRRAPAFPQKGAATPSVDFALGSLLEDSASSTRRLRPRGLRSTRAYVSALSRSPCPGCDAAARTLCRASVAQRTYSAMHPIEEAG